MLEIRGLRKVYAGGVVALDRVTLEIPSGIFGLLGPNGSGKTTLMRILAGLLEASDGEVRFDGESLTEDPSRIWPRLGHLPQYFGFYPHLTGRAMLRHMLRLKGVTHPRGDAWIESELLERVNLTYAADRAVKTYSGGMRQRLGIAQAIAGNPALLIVDEPTAGLDPEERLRFYRLLSELAQDRTVILSTHIVEDVAMLCSRLAIIRYGQLLATTTPAEARARLAGTMYAGQVERHDLERVSSIGRVTSAYLIEGRDQVRLHLPSGSPPPGFEATAPTLEDAYLLLTQQDAEARAA